MFSLIWNTLNCKENDEKKRNNLIFELIMLGLLPKQAERVELLQKNIQIP